MLFANNLKPLLSKEKFLKNILKIKVGDELNIDEVIRKLVECGYERNHTTYKIGDFSVRGEVLDIFPSCFSDPIRINLAFDEVESIRYFDLETQLTKKGNIKSVEIYPMYEVCGDINLDDLEQKILSISKTQEIQEDFSVIIKKIF